MYNRSVDEKNFSDDPNGVIEFLKGQPEVIDAKLVAKNPSKDNKPFIKVKFNKQIHPARKFTIAKTTQEDFDFLDISVVEDS